MSLPTKRTKTLAGLVGLLLLSVPLSACSFLGIGGGVKADAYVPDLSAHAKGEATTVTLDKKFLSAVTSLGLTPSTYQAATLKGADLSFPITGGWVELFKPDSVPQYVVGQIQHEGSGLTLTAGKTSVTIGNFNVDPGRGLVYGDAAVNGVVKATSVPIFTLDGSTLNDPKTNGTKVTLQGTEVYVSSVAAGLLNATFKTKALSNKVLVGIASITIDSKA